MFAAAAAAVAFLRRLVGRFVVDVDVDVSSLSELAKDGDALLAVDVDTRPALYRRFELYERMNTGIQSTCICMRTLYRPEEVLTI